MPAPKGNKYYLLRENSGAKPFYETPTKMAAKAIEYFEKCDESEENLTVTGLIYHLGFVDKKSLRDYKGKKDFSPLIKRMLLLVEENYEKRLSETACTGAIFALKNMGWYDRKELTGKDGEQLFSNMTDKDKQDIVRKIQDANK